MHHELEAKIKPISDMKEKLICALEAEIATGLDRIDTNEMGEIVDMIKDLSEAERNCFEKGYYYTVIGAMEEGENTPRYGEDRMGYNNRRYANSQYAPKGHGHISGYNPLIRDFPYIEENLRYGYMGLKKDGTDRYGYYDEMRHGKAYHDFQNARKYYTESHSDSDKRLMEQHANEHLADTVATLRDIWKDAEPDLRKRMKRDLEKLIEEMNV